MEDFARLSVLGPLSHAFVVYLGIFKPTKLGVFQTGGDSADRMEGGLPGGLFPHRPSWKLSRLCDLKFLLIDVSARPSPE